MFKQDCIRTIWFHFLKNFGMDKLKKETTENDGEPSAKRRKIDVETDKGKGPKLLSLEFDPMEEINLDITSENSSSSSCGEEADEDVHIPGLFTRSSANTKERSSVSYLTLMSCVAMCYLGLLYTRETVLLVDIAR